MAVHSTPFRVWPKTTHKVTREEERRRREEGIYIVRVILDENDEATVFRHKKIGLRHQPLKPKEKDMMGDDRRAFFLATWSTPEVRWNLIEKTDESFA